MIAQVITPVEEGVGRLPQYVDIDLGLGFPDKNDGNQREDIRATLAGAFFFIYETKVRVRFEDECSDCGKIDCNYKCIEYKNRNL